MGFIGPHLEYYATGGGQWVNSFLRGVWAVKISLVDLRNPLTYYELKCKMRFIMGRKSQMPPRWVNMAQKPDTAKTGNKQANKQEKNRGLFKPGQSGNPKGRPKTIEDKELKELEKLAGELNTLEGNKLAKHGPDPSKVFRLVGLGEIAVARIVKRLAERAKSEVVRLRACELAAKVLRMIREDSQEREGITVIIQALEGSAQQVNLTPPGQPPQLQQGSYQHPQPAKPGQPIQITK